MKQNKYDELDFFNAYAQMSRSIHGLKAAWEWHVLKELMPNLKDKRVLDLGCGYGWHCGYAESNGAASVIGVDLSKKMLEKAQELHGSKNISFLNKSIEEVTFPQSSFDVVISSLALHYVKDYREVVHNVYDLLAEGGTFLFSVEHPIFTSRPEQDWYVNEKEEILHWPIDSYQEEDRRETSFLTNDVVKYHRTISTYINELISAGFIIQAVEEPKPTEEALKESVEMRDELRRPMFLMVLVRKA
ncbi:class I SAM-dependent methyltransferase [Alkalicoccobacillus plakortidis]|uniref:Methyltransferase domain-containing protein n=1 Tax=Alkalicoccobacillus plakortidis TaxID=444060 RepID=A0ABT0XNT4_9BACI|nr:class I SAM-dependent methyltransferase [Alkalicoccobacillus plakortidis]MCM2677541.1 methyltransferase domain-containing protein [Alkalicoccobacillus plakortidis]